MMMQATPPPQPAPTAAVMTVVSKDTETDGGELFSYLFTPNPEVSSILTLPPGGKTEWMAHAVQVYIYVLEGTLTVEFEGGHRLSFKAGQAFLQAQNGTRGSIWGPRRCAFWACCMVRRECRTF